MPSINVIFLMGFATRDSEFRKIPNGSGVCNFAIAVNYGSGDNKKTEFFNCVIWDRPNAPVAEWASQIKKGDLVFAQGRLQTRDWEDREGNTRKQVEVVCNQVVRCMGKDNKPDPDSIASGWFEPNTDWSKKADDARTKLKEVDPDQIPF
jgi:single-strand DNA-binding protein